MTEKERRFIIKRKQAHEEQVSKLNKTLSNSKWLIGICAFGGVCSFIGGIGSAMNHQARLVTLNFITLSVNAGLTFTFAIRLIITLLKKFKYQGRIEEIEEELACLGEEIEEEKLNTSAYEGFMRSNPHYIPLGHDAPILEVPKENERVGKI